MLTNKERHYKIKSIRKDTMRTQDIVTTNRNQPNNRNQLDMSRLCVAKGSRIQRRLKALQIIRISEKL